MKFPAGIFLVWCCLYAQDYKLGPDSLARGAGVPKGSVTAHQWTSKIYPGTKRNFWIYVPAQYKGDKAVPVMIFQDGHNFVGETGAWRAPVVFDNLIHRGEIPVMLGIFIEPGVLPALSSTQQNRYNRSYEYDALGDRYARFLTEEILPEAGKHYKISSDPNDRGIAGSSSGGIAAFTAAWNRPDVFRRVLSFIGSYTNLRGGHSYATLVRKAEGKPLRVFLQDGSNDLNIYSGSWWIANQDLAEALKFAGYDYTFVTGNEAHNSKHGSAILPDALRWLWRDHPKPVRLPKSVAERRYVSEIAVPDAGWELVSRGHRFTEGPAADKEGNVYFTDIPNNRIHKIAAGSGQVTVFKEDSGAANGMMFGPDGRLYVCQNGRKQIVSYNTADGSEKVVAEGVNSNDITVGAKGDIYFTDPSNKRVWYIDAKGNKRVVLENAGIEFPNGVRLSPDQSLLTVADSRNKWIWSFQVQPDGSLAHGQAFYRMEMPDETGFSGADGMTFDTDGHLYVATRLGVQICDQPGRVVAVFNKPQNGPLSNVVFGGVDRKMLYVTAGEKVYRRPVTRTGAMPWEISKPPQPRL